MLDPARLRPQRQKLFIPVTGFSGYAPRFYVQETPNIGTNMEIGFSTNDDAGALVGGAGITAEHFIGGADAPNRLVGAGAGAPRITEISTFGITGLLMSAAADDIRHTMLIPSGWDRRHAVRVRIIFATGSGTAADTITWLFNYLLLIPGTTVLAKAATALDTPLVIETVTGTANTIERTATPGVINAGNLGITALYWSFLVEMDAIAAGLAEDVHLLGVEFEFTPRTGRGHKSIEARDWTF